MNHKARKYITAFVAVVICISTFTLFAFGADITRETPGGDQTAGGTTTGGNQTAGGTTTGGNQTAGGTTTGGTTAGGGTTTGGKTGGDVGHESTGGSVTVVFNLNGGSGMRTSGTFDKGTKISEFKNPYRKGYIFNGWLINGTEVSGSMPINSDTTLSAEWIKITNASSTAGKSSETVSTDQNAIDQAARDAEEAGSDPGMLSSEDWSALLNSSSSDSSLASESSSAVSSQAPNAGGTSKLFIIGIVLAVLGLTGVGVFIYLQFIYKPGGPNHPDGTGGTGDDDTAVFTNLSSYSDGRPHTADTDALHKAQAGQLGEENPSEEKTQVVRLPDSPAAQPQPPKEEPQPPKEKPQPKHQPPRHLAKSQAKPVEPEKSDFDWEQFFHDEDEK